MTAEDGDLRTSESNQDELEERRRSRLWLGYSEDNLRNLQTSTNNQSSLQEDEQVPSASPDLSRQRSGSQVYEPYNDYQNLNEVAAPLPIEYIGDGREQGYLEDRDKKQARNAAGMPNNFQNLNEFADPAPVKAASKKYTNGCLEDREQDGITKGTKTRSMAGRGEVSKLATEIYTISYLILFSIFGTLARLGLQALTFYPGAPVQTGLLWCNVGGSLIMGFLSKDKKLFREERSRSTKFEDTDEHADTSLDGESAKNRLAGYKKTLPLYIGLAIGFCGSFTSFSSFMRDAFFALSNALPVPINHPSSTPISSIINVPRNPGYSFLAVLAVLITTVGLSLMAILFGAHLALLLEPYTPSIPYIFVRKIIDRIVVFLAFGVWFAALLMSIWPPDRPAGPIGNKSWAQETWRSQALFAIVFAPLGCLLRFYLSLHLNGRIKAFPLGTFAVNIFGTVLAAIFTDLQRVPIGGIVGCQVLQGMLDGFCGCLTTVSTWVAELIAMRIKHAYFYGFVSVATALGILVIITGSLQWTKGFIHPLCTS